MPRLLTLPEKVFVVGVALLAALVLGACSGDEEAPGPTAAVEPSPAATATPERASTPRPSPTATAEPTHEPSPTPTATAEPAATQTPVAALSLEVTAETTWQEAFDALTPRERDCIREAVGRDSLAGVLQLTVMGDDGPFEESVSAFIACLDPDTARHLLLSTMLVGMQEEGVAPSERDRACLQDWVSGVDIADLMAGGEELILETLAVTMRCLPHVMALEIVGTPEEGVEIDEAARDCLRAWGADTDWPLVIASGQDAFGVTLLGGLAGCTPDLAVAMFLSESGAGLEDLSGEQLTCLREWIAEVDWAGLIEEGGEGMDALLAAAGLVQCAPELLQPGPDTGEVPTSLLHPDESLLWHYPAEGWVVRPPAVHGGVVFFASDDDRVHAVDAASGAPLWRFEAADGVGMTPIATGEAVYVGSENSHVYALDRDTGELLWDLDTGESAGSYPTAPSLTVSGGVVYAAVLSDEQREIRALDGESGEVLWIAASPHVEAAPAVIGGKVYGPSGGYEDEFRVLDASTGERLWSLEARGRELRPTVSGGVVYLTAFDTAYALDEATGRTIWSYVADGSPSNSPAVVEDGVYYFSPQERLHALDAETGAVLWSYTADDIIISGPVVAGGVVCLGTWSGQVHALDAATGEVLWVEANEEWVLSFLVADGVLYFESGGTLRALDAATGEEVWRFFKGGGSLIGSTFMVADGVVYVGSLEGFEGGGVYAFQAPAGADREQ